MILDGGDEDPWAVNLATSWFASAEVLEKSAGQF
jgi:hypothetical protein